LIPVTTDLLRRVDRFVRSLPPQTFLRAGDAIHLVSAIEYGFDEVWTDDRHLLAAAAAAGLSGKCLL
jgi:hypothetical protein